jgi:hypothetical protein
MSSYLLESDFTLQKTKENNFLTLTLATNYSASFALAGLYIYLGNNPKSILDTYKIGVVNALSRAHNYVLPNNIKLSYYKNILY